MAASNAASSSSNAAPPDASAPSQSAAPAAQDAAQQAQAPPPQPAGQQPAQPTQASAPTPPSAFANAAREAGFQVEGMSDEQIAQVMRDHIVRTRPYVNYGQQMAPYADQIRSYFEQQGDQGQAGALDLEGGGRVGGEGDGHGGRAERRGRRGWPHHANSAPGDRRCTRLWRRASYQPGVVRQPGRTGPPTGGLSPDVRAGPSVADGLRLRDHKAWRRGSGHTGPS
jgi:hypothetical protein